MNPKKSLGQNFLKDETVLQKIANSFDTKEDDLVIEVGPGRGALTKYLVEKPSKLICYELDKDLIPLLNKYNTNKSKVIHGDFLKEDISNLDKHNNLYLIANVPYYITTPIISKVLDLDETVKGMTLLVQKEVGLRFASNPGTKDYGYYTVLLNHFFNVSLLGIVPPSSFYPSPKVDSIIVKFERKDSIDKIDIEGFKNFLKDAFQNKRKTLTNNLKKYNKESLLMLLEDINKSSNARAEELSYEELKYLFVNLS